MKRRGARTFPTARSRKCITIFSLTFVAWHFCRVGVLSNVREQAKSDELLDSALRILSPCGIKLPVEKRCVRLLHGMREVRAGLGHQIAELVFFAQLSKLFRATYVHEPFQNIKSDHKTSYQFVNQFLGLHSLRQKLDIDLAKLRVVHLNDTENMDCNVVFMGGFRSCPGGDCFLSPVMRHAYANFAPCLREHSMQHGYWSHSNPYTKETFNVFWHVRIGDRIPHGVNDPYFENIHAGLKSLINSLQNVHHHVCGQWQTSRYNIREQFILKFRRFLHNDNVHFPVLNLEDTMLHMLHANILIGSGSSLSSVVPLFSNKPLYLNVQPKHGWNFLAEDALEAVQITNDGHIVTPMVEIQRIMEQKLLEINHGAL